jgi:protein-S-isoprenylcysteine O-methyltransferase Ste14
MERRAMQADTNVARQKSLRLVRLISSERTLDEAWYKLVYGAGCCKTSLMNATSILAWVDAPLMLGFGSYIAYYLESRSLWGAQSFIGMGMAIVGLALWSVARIQLGKSFSIAPEAKALVTTGLYARIRHPVYAFGGLVYVGLFVAWGKWVPLVLIASIQLMQIRRVRREERVLEQAFGEEYRRYKARTWL